MKAITLFILSVFVVLLIWGTKDFPIWGDPHSPANSHVSPYYLENSLKDTDVPNVVTSVLADYRGFDTMLETTVVLIAGIAVSLILRRKHDSNYIRRDQVSEPDSGLVITTTAKLIIPPALIFAFYVLAHGHHSPGGGFQSGVIFGSVLILYAFSFGLSRAEEVFSEKLQSLCTFTGVLIYSGIGTLCYLLGGNFLDYGRLSLLLPMEEKYCRSLGILGVEIGVAITVMAVMFSIYSNLVSGGCHEEGL